MAIDEFLGIYPAHFLTGMAATLVIVMGIRGLAVHLFQRQKKAAWHLAMAMILAYAGGAGRTMHWDMLRVFMTPEAWIQFRDTIRGIQFNAIWNLILLWSGIHLHAMLWYLLPLLDRDRYSIWTAWNHPLPMPSLGYLIARLRSTKRK